MMGCVSNQVDSAAGANGRQTRVALPARLLEAKSIVLLPACTLDEAVAPVEILLEEGLPVVSIPAGSRLTPAMLRRTFGGRIEVGVHDLRTADDAEWAKTEKAAFALSLGEDAARSSILFDARIPECPDALTPTEVRALWKRIETAAVQVNPAGALGANYPGQLAELISAHTLLISRGADSVHEIKAWLAAGAVAVCLGERLTADAFRRGNLSSFRSRIHPVVDALRQPRR